MHKITTIVIVVILSWKDLPVLRNENIYKLLLKRLTGVWLYVVYIQVKWKKTKLSKTKTP